MPKKIQKTLQDYLTKIKTRHPPQLQLPFNSISSSKSWILSGCKHPKTPSFALEGRKSGGGSSSSSNDNSRDHDHNHKEDVAATLADVDRFLLENFKSLYVKDDHDDDDNDDDNNEATGNKNNKNTKRVFLEDRRRDEEGPKLGPILFDSPRLVEIPRDLCGSTRFFVKPGFSGSLMEDANTTFDRDESGSTATAITTNDSSSKEGKAKLPDNCIALLTYTPSPYEEFRRSMQEMVEARARNNEGDIDWEFMEELLFCYLNLNEKKSHKFILSAFVDLATTMRQNAETAVAAKPRSVRTFTIDRKVIKKF
ncbi:hypothetical protein RIF29_28155 [Crotalaria pallida]|uniref:Transcription repressor n=1 Tax=Crotalaria pallida TaxID=3830 RepID=A0AAN9I1P5_CROPI